MTGAGALVTHVWDPATETLVTWAHHAGHFEPLRVFSGPHPTDPTKWRMTVSLTDVQRLRVRLWVAVLGIDCS